ncbi:DUF6928 family protein, partial [Kitasatospora sp. NPDC059747]|uniref:DUF6928 family protein n=1 Tax=Kitasatospora sp. NPDC059747 TaxID=3346930 RepID=UPI00365CDD28
MELAATGIPWPDRDDRPYPLPFHPLEMGEDALRALCGFVLEGLPAPDDVDADAVGLHGFLVRDPGAPEPPVVEAQRRATVAAAGARGSDTGGGGGARGWPGAAA